MMRYMIRWGSEGRWQWVGAILVTFFLMAGMGGLRVAQADLPGPGRCPPSPAHRAAIDRAEAALATLSADDPGYLQTLMVLADRYTGLGFHERARAVLAAGLEAGDAIADSRERARFLSALADVHLSLGRPAEARRIAEQAEDAAIVADDPAVMAAVLNDLGNALRQSGEPAAAGWAYAESRYLIDTVPAGAHCGRGRPRSQGPSPGPDLRLLAVRVRLNTAQLELDRGHRDRARAELSAAAEATPWRELPAMRQTGESLIALAQLSRKMAESSAPAAAESLRIIAADALAAAETIADRLDDPRLAAGACVLIGRLHEDRGEIEAAFQQARQALFHAQRGRFPEIRYRSQWQLGRLYRRVGDFDRATKWFREATETLSGVRAELMTDARRGDAVFADEVRPVYLGLARLLLESARRADSPGRREQQLIEARDVMETLKAAELENYFKDECVAELQTQRTRLDRAPAGTAVLYPIIFPDTTALLVTLPDGIRLVFTPVSAHRINTAVRRFRAYLQSPETGNRYHFFARRLHDWLIRPVAPLLAENRVRTLIVAPDGALRLIPFSALHDGNGFIAERYAVVTVPSITLSDPQPLAIADTQALLAGLTEARMGFSALPAVHRELSAIQSLIGGTILKDATYTEENLQAELRRRAFGIVHLATHGEFGGTAADTFLLTSAGRLTMDRLEELIGLGRFREQPLALLTLSACQTALGARGEKGDERAALGLAGVAVKAGARSAVATLWSVDDEATATAVQIFYKRLKAGDATRAEALQAAQVALISGGQYRHPAFWAPFLLIGSWM